MLAISRPLGESAYYHYAVSIARQTGRYSDLYRAASEYADSVEPRYACGCQLLRYDCVECRADVKWNYVTFCGELARISRLQLRAERCADAARGARGPWARAFTAALRAGDNRLLEDLVDAAPPGQHGAYWVGAYHTGNPELRVLTRNGRVVLRLWYYWCHPDSNMAGGTRSEFVSATVAEFERALRWVRNVMRDRRAQEWRDVFVATWPDIWPTLAFDAAKREPWCRQKVPLRLGWEYQPGQQGGTLVAPDGTEIGSNVLALALPIQTSPVAA